MNTTLTSLVNDVYTLTNRPDLVGETLLAVRNATLKAHNSDYYSKDLFETGIVFDFPSHLQSIDYKLLVPRWRAPKYLRKFFPDPSGISGTDGDFLEVVSPDQILDSYSVNKENICYVAGAELKIKSNTVCQHYLLGCYRYPDVTVDNYSSWIADEQPAAILYEAVLTVFKTIGFDEQVSTYTRLVQEEYQQLKMNLALTGY